MDFIDKKSIKIVQDLPDDVKEHIFKEFFELRNESDYFLNWLKENYRLDKDLKDVEDTVKKILTSPVALEYLFKENDIIKNCYQDHYISNLKTFQLMSLNHSFITSILMYMWH